jgi:hypothetical protein
MTHIKIFQILNGVEHHLVTVELSKELSDYDTLEEFTKLIYENDKAVYLVAEKYSVVFYPHQGPVKFELV